MATIVIDLMGDEDTIVIGPPPDPHAEARAEEARKKALEEIFRRAPQPALQIVPTE